MTAPLILYDSATNDELTYYPRPRVAATDDRRPGSLLLLSGAVITLACLAGGRAPGHGPPDAPASTRADGPTRMSAVAIGGRPVCQRETRPTLPAPILRAMKADTEAGPIARLTEPVPPTDGRPTVAQLATRLRRHDPTFWTLDIGPPPLLSVTGRGAFDLDVGGRGRQGAVAAAVAGGTRRPLTNLVPIAALLFGSLILLVPAACAGGAALLSPRSRGSPGAADPSSLDGRVHAASRDAVVPGCFFLNDQLSAVSGQPD